MDSLLLAANDLTFIESLMGYLPILGGLMGLGFVIFVHELGHFLVAKSCGVQCDKFYVGFDVPIGFGKYKISSLWKVQWGETEYGIGTIPLGGYVKMLGQDDNPGNAEEEGDRTKITATNEEGEEVEVVNPRSYTAKNVPQRMAIISAGVIFNLISGVIFATIAYGMGVSYTPCAISLTQPGSPAWVAGLNPGDEITSLTSDRVTREHLRFSKDLMLAVVVAGEDGELPVTVKNRDGNVINYTISPYKMNKDAKMPMLGVSPMNTLDLSGQQTYFSMYYGDELTKLITQGDSLVSVNGEKFGNYLEYQAYLANHPYDELNYIFKTKSGDSQGTDTYTLDLPPLAYRATGLIMKMTPILQIRKGSPAEEAGLLKGDVIKTIQGNPVGDPFTLTSRETKWAGETIEVVVVRGTEDDTLTIHTVKPEYAASAFGMGSKMSLNSMGATFSLTNVVDSVTPDSPADLAGLVADSQIMNIEFLTTSKAGGKKEEKFKFSTDPYEVNSDEIPWQVIQSRIQSGAVDTELEITYKNPNEADSIVTKLTPAVSETEFLVTRGLKFQTKQEIHTAKSLGEAFFLGRREVWEGMGQVITVLKKLATGKLAVTNLGGPGTIIAVAAMESSEGPARLLLFLTLISANLAVVNFLPIPVLDGGHMMFLTYEGIRGKPMNEQIQFKLTLLGLVMVLTLMVCVIGLDINRFLPWFL
ncbi:MAG: site-2 protease family protein [Pirellulales bacterium]